MNTISSVANSNAYNPQTTNKVAETNSANLANNAATQSAFSSYISQAFAQMSVANPTHAKAPVVSGSNETSATKQDEKESVSTFIQDLFSILSQDKSQKNSAATTKTSQDNESAESSSNDNESDEVNTTALTAYNSGNSTTVGNIIANLQELVNKLDANQTSKNNNSTELQTLQNDFQSILDAQGATTENPASLRTFLSTLAENLDGQSPLGIIINTFG